MWNLDEQARTVAALAVGVEAASMGKPGERLHAEGDGVMPTIWRGDEAHATRSSRVGQVPRPGQACGRQRGGH